MYRLWSQPIKFSPEHKRVLQNLVIGKDGPGTIVRDFEAMLGFLKMQDLPVTGRHQLTLRALPHINARLARPLQLGLKRPQQKSYPHINGLYLLVRASGLTYIGGTAKKPLLVVDDVVYQSWESLNPTERYCTLLESWLLRGHPKIIGASRYRLSLVPETFRDWSNFFRRVPDAGMQVAGSGEAELWRYRPGWHNLGLLELFNLISVQHGSPEAGKGWRIERIQRTPLGDALLALLDAEFFDEFDNVLQLEAAGKVPFGALQPALQIYFPEWKNNLSVPEWAFREGAYIFKVSLWQIWRRIAIPADCPLDALASIILDAVEFDHDHLYEFSYHNRFGVLEKVYHPHMNEGPWTDKVLVGHVPLRVGQTMTYLFDYGDSWVFDVTLERIDPDMSIEAPVVLEKHGEPPEQYSSWDDWA